MTSSSRRQKFTHTAGRVINNTVSLFTHLPPSHSLSLTLSLVSPSPLPHSFPAEPTVARIRRVANVLPNSLGDHSQSLVTLPNCGAFSNRRCGRKLANGNNRSPATVRFATRALARDSISRTRGDAVPCDRLARTENGTHRERRSEQACLPACLIACLLACLRACLPACLPRSVNSPRPPRCLSREWPVYMLTLCLRVFLPLPNLAGSRLPPLSRPGTDDPRSFPSSSRALYHSPSLSVSLDVSCLSLSRRFSLLPSRLPVSLSPLSFSLSVATRVFAMPNKARFTPPRRWNYRPVRKIDEGSCDPRSIYRIKLEIWINYNNFILLSRNLSAAV